MAQRHYLLFLCTRGNMHGNKNSYLTEPFRTGNCFLILVPNMGILNAILPGSGILIDD